MKLLVTSGYYDLATPYFAAHYTLDHMNLEPAVRDNIQMTYYESGHMLYLRLDDLVRLRQDVEDFIGFALAR